MCCATPQIRPKLSCGQSAQRAAAGHGGGMNERLSALLAAQDGVCSTADARRVGLDDSDLDHLVRAGRLHRARRAAFVDASAWSDATPEQRYLLRTKAILRARPDDAASHNAALLLHDIRTYGVDLTIVDLISNVKAMHVRAGVRTHPRPPTWLRRGLWSMVDRPTALAQVAGTNIVSGGVSIDHALQSTVCTVEEVTAAVSRLPTSLARKRASSALGLADPQSESVGETRTRLLLTDLGYEVRSQVWIDTSGGAARVDLLLEGLVVVEFDGAVKYAGQDGRDALVREKQRESALTALGYEVVRVTWSDLADVHALHRRILIVLGRARARRAPTG